ERHEWHRAPSPSARAQRGFRAAPASRHIARGSQRVSCTVAPHTLPGATPLSPIGTEAPRFGRAVAGGADGMPWRWRSGDPRRAPSVKPNKRLRLAMEHSPLKRHALDFGSATRLESFEREARGCDGRHPVRCDGHSGSVTHTEPRARAKGRTPSSLLSYLR